VTQNISFRIAGTPANIRIAYHSKKLYQLYINLTSDNDDNGDDDDDNNDSDSNNNNNNNNNNVKK
jgi:hypothetical protein